MLFSERSGQSSALRIFVMTKIGASDSVASVIVSLVRTGPLPLCGGLPQTCGTFNVPRRCWFQSGTCTVEFDLFYLMTLWKYQIHKRSIEMEVNFFLISSQRVARFRPALKPLSLGFHCRNSRPVGSVTQRCRTLQCFQIYQVLNSCL